MFNVLAEDTLSIEQCLDLLPRGRNNSRPRFATVWRWCLKGCRAPDGSRVKLEAVRVGGRLCTSKEALQRFFERLTGTNNHQPAPMPKSSAVRAKDIKSAQEELAQAGI